MSLGLIGKKIGMTRLFSEAGSVIPVTIVQAGPCPVLQVKRQATDGYTAIQLGFDSKEERKATKAEIGHFKKSGGSPLRMVREFRTEDVEPFPVGGKVDVGIFEVGEKVDVTGVSKGRGFASLIKRWSTTRGPETHGSMYHRRPGSMGGSSDPSRSWKGKHLSGHMGSERCTAQNLKVVRVDKDKNLLALCGAVPGFNGGYVLISKSLKDAKRKAARAAKGAAK